MPVRSSVRDQATRQRLLETAAHLFAERGFRKVTVRDISREAAANAAAINYHFGDKLGLYEEVVRFAAARMESSEPKPNGNGKARSPQQQLRSYIRVFLRHLLTEEEDSWMDKLIGREMADPTPGLDLIIEHGIRPSSQRLARLVRQILDCPPNDERVWQSAVSIQAQCFFYRFSKPVFARMAPGLKMNPEMIDRIADHIADFSLAGLRSLARDGKLKAKHQLAVAS